MIRRCIPYLLVSVLAVWNFSSFGQTGSCSHARQKMFRTQATQTESDARKNDYDVHYYFLDLTASQLSTNLAGTCEIQATTRSAIDTFVLDLVPAMVVQEVKVEGNTTPFAHTDSLLRIPVSAATGQHIRLQISYAGTALNGYFNRLDVNEGVSWTLSEPYKARCWFPVKESLTDKADSVDVWITVPDSCKAGSNGLLTQVSPVAPGFLRYEWKHRHPIAYYLISLAISEYDEYTFTATPTDAPPVLIQNFIYQNSLAAKQVEIEKTGTFLELFTDKFGPYPFSDEKYGHCEGPLGGGMEHQTMTTQDGFNDHLTAHELGHQWWGNQVTCATWKDLWINEGFASYSEDLMLEYTDPLQQKIFMQLRHNDIISSPGGSVYVADTADIPLLFSIRLTYNKGSAIIHTLRYLIHHDSLFFATLKEFLQAYADSNATGRDLVEFMEAETGKDLEGFIQQWYFGQGYPTYSLRWNKVADSLLVEISQQTSHNSVSFFTNPVDLRIQRENLPDTLIRFDIQSGAQQFKVVDPSLMSVAEIDPENWIINAVGSIQQDPGFVEVGTTDALDWKQRVKVVPNPTTDYWQIESPVPLEVALMDLYGKIREERTLMTDATIDASWLPAGMYVLKLTSSYGSISVPVIRR